LSADEHPSIKNMIVIMRSTRRKNMFINYKFLSKYENILFLGLKSEYDDLKIEVPNLEFYDCKDFLEAAQIIKSSNFFIGNSSFGFTIAEGLKVPRIMESYPDFPVIYPNGNHGYDFYFQVHFEELCKKLYKLKT
jgi:ADP-heptose:LPS heptosyltransferase